MNHICGISITLVTSARYSPTISDLPPDFLTVEEAAEVLRIGRTAAYKLARQYLATDGDDGLPVIRMGRQLRVPRLALEDMTGGPITWPLPSVTPTALEPVPAPGGRANACAVAAAPPRPSTGRSQPHPFAPSRD